MEINRDYRDAFQLIEALAKVFKKFFCHSEPVEE